MVVVVFGLGLVHDLLLLLLLLVVAVVVVVVVEEVEELPSCPVMAETNRTNGEVNERMMMIVVNKKEKARNGWQ